MLLLGLTGDQVIRALDHTYDRTWQGDYSVSIAGRVDLEMSLIIPVVSIVLILLSLLVWNLERRQAREEQQQEGYSPPLQGSLNVWGALALGAILYLELSLLGLPNAIARWANTDYAGIVPWLLGATALPLVPEVRDVARRFAGMFDGVWRGWLWALVLGILLVVGRRFDGIVAGLALVFAQFMVGLTLWWLVQTGLPRRNFTGFTILFSAVSFGILALGDYFTYDYAYVRDLDEPFENVGDFLRSFRDMGLGLTLIAAFVLSIPMILARRRIPWRGGRPITTLVAMVLVVAVSSGRDVHCQPGDRAPSAERGLPARGDVQPAQRLFAVLRLESRTRRPVDRAERGGHRAAARGRDRSPVQLRRRSGHVVGPPPGHGMDVLPPE